MAEPKPAKPQASKRIVKNPETFRERAVKASQASDKPSRLSNFRQASGQVAKPVFKPVGTATGKFIRFKPFRILAKPLKLIGIILLLPYFRNSWIELRQVTWPTLRQSRQLTSAVLVFAIIFGAVIALVDFGLDKIFRNVLLK